MARLIKINPDETRETIHDVPGVGVSARRKYGGSGGGTLYAPQEFFAVRVLKRPPGEDQTEYYVELDRSEAASLVRDLTGYLNVP